MSKQMIPKQILGTFPKCFSAGVLVIGKTGEYIKVDFLQIHGRHKLIVTQLLTLPMQKSLALAITVVLLMLASAEATAAQFYKCSVNGAVQYQQSPCQSIDGRKPPTVEELNAARQKQLAQEGERRASQRSQARPLPTPETIAQEPRTPLAAPGTSFKCDRRKYCTQMTSCAEAKYFLSNCPGVMMDGDGDGIPCEEQHCGH